mmetsp:Transcript_86591/g.207347  ORF Transcript_86591/g.207347 Transcript_86591/m.207347 type:complete len:250 (+) Transcript_86591:253-1002(+)
MPLMRCTPFLAAFALALASARAFRCCASCDNALGFTEVPWVNSFGPSLPSFSSWVSSTTRRPSVAKRRPLRRRASTLFSAPAPPTFDPRILFDGGARTVSTEWAASADMKSRGTSPSSWIQVEAATSPRLRLPFARPWPSSLSDSASQASRSACTALCAITASVGGSCFGPSGRVRFLALRVPSMSSSSGSNSASSSPALKVSQVSFSCPFFFPDVGASSGSSHRVAFSRTVLGRHVLATCFCTCRSRA